jgi:hypothetical protein
MKYRFRNFVADRDASTCGGCRTLIRMADGFCHLVPLHRHRHAASYTTHRDVNCVSDALSVCGVGWAHREVVAVASGQWWCLPARRCEQLCRTLFRRSGPVEGYLEFGRQRLSQSTITSYDSGLVRWRTHLGRRSKRWDTVGIHDFADFFAAVRRNPSVPRTELNLRFAAWLPGRRETERCEGRVLLGH